MIRDVVPRGLSIDWCYGSNRHPSAPSQHFLALYDQDGVELSGAGYARATVTPDMWAPVDAEGTKSFIVTFAPPTGEWAEVVSWCLLGAQGWGWDSAELAEPLLVTGASDTGPVVTATVFYSEVSGEDV